MHRHETTVPVLIFAAVCARGQIVDTAAISRAVSLFDLHFTPAEIDSMVDGVKENLQNYQKMHRQPTPNDLPFPLCF